MTWAFILFIFQVFAIYFLQFGLPKECPLKTQILDRNPSLYRAYYSTVMGINNEIDLPFHGLTENIFENISNCGDPAIDINEAIIKGQDAPQKAWPWQVFLITTDSTKRREACGGSLISESWVLTAAHCVIDVKVRVFLGLTDWTTAEEDAGRNDSGVRIRTGAVIVVHKSYVSNDLSDIALIKLDTPVEFTDYVRPICLPKPGQELHDQQAGDCYTTGWGRRDYFQQISSALQQIKVNIMPQSLCIYGWLLRRSFFDRRFLCVDLNDAGSGICLGDSGGPLACKVDGRFVLVGVTHAVPARFNCTYNFFPSAHIRVSEYLEWIAIHIKENG